MKILIINGPNLNMLGKRETSLYGTWTVSEVEKELSSEFSQCTLDFFQSNSEGAIIDRIHQAVNEDWHGVVINPGAYTHTSIAIADALKILSCPIVEVHISNIWKREKFRHVSYVAPVATGQITGMGKYSYFLAVQALLYFQK